jgi:pimeloyl-ACP methyl ester carboxylesterase
MMVLFQNKIIYMPSVPPFSRSEKISDYENACRPIIWRQEMMRSLDGTKIALAIGSNVSMQRECPGEGAGEAGRCGNEGSSGLVLLYFQGNASSLPPRLPSLSSVLKLLDRQEPPIPCTLIALSYRGFWTSSGRASQSGIEQDAAAALAWTHGHQESLGMETKLVLWGQSIGAGIAATAVANLLQRNQDATSTTVVEAAKHAHSFDALILETPFTSIKSMLITLYPQKWLPYRYLWPFLMSTWDNEKALRVIHEGKGKVPLLIVTAEKDEVVSAEHGDELVRLCEKLGMDMRRVRVAGALHTEAMGQAGGREGVVGFLKEVHQAGP